MRSIARVQTDDRNINQLQNNIITGLQPITANPLVDGNFLTAVSLSTGQNAVNTGLGRKLQGWVIIRQRASASVYDNQDNNSTPAQTLLLVASAPVSVDLYVF